jgi:hypothetical protein
MFDPRFGDCLVRNGTKMGLSQPVPWKVQIDGGHISGGTLSRSTAVR